MEYTNKFTDNQHDFRYRFKRDAFFKLCDSIQANEVTFLLGPRKCGKTVCMKQYAHEYADSAEYIDIKSVVDKKSTVDYLKECILKKYDKTILVDECTYFSSPAEDIQSIITCYDEVESPTRIVFSSSQSVALEAWANRSFSGNTGIVRVDFIDFREWLAYKSLPLSEDSYFDFILNTDAFYDFKSCEAYLAGCLNETVLSNQKAIDQIPFNDCDLINADILILVLYSILFSKHNHISYEQIAKADRLSQDLDWLAQDVQGAYDAHQDVEVSDEDIAVLFSRLQVNYKLFSMLDANTIKQAIVFLYKCGLISISCVVSDLAVYKDPLYEFMTDYAPLNKKSLFKDYNFTIKYPMFYISVIKSLKLPKDMAVFSGPVLRSLVECHIKGLLTDRFCVEYHDDTGAEIDCIDLKRQLAIECTVSDRHKRSALESADLPGYTKIMTSRTKCENTREIKRIPYYKFICDLAGS